MLVGINLLREGLDIPEVSLVAVLDADKEGFLRSHASLVQTFGRAARNASGRVILYADTVTGSMREAMEETSRRREKQEAHNLAMGITPVTVRKDMENVLDSLYSQIREETAQAARLVAAENPDDYGVTPASMKKTIRRLEREMREAAKDLAFERAAALRARIAALREKLLSRGEA